MAPTVQVSLGKILDAVIRFGDDQLIADAVAAYLKAEFEILVDPKSFDWTRRLGTQINGVTLALIPKVEESEEREPVGTFRLAKAEGGEVIVEGTWKEIMAKIDSKWTRVREDAMNRMLKGRWKMEVNETKILSTYRSRWVYELTRISWTS